MPRYRAPRLVSAFACAVSLAALACGSGPALAGDSAPLPDVPLIESHDDWGRFGIQTQWIDAKARPGDDFDRYANGRWNDTIQIAADKTRIGAFMSLRDLSEDRVKAILDDLAATKHPAGSAEARIGAVYSAFMDTAAIEAAGMAPARPWLDRT